MVVVIGRYSTVQQEVSGRYSTVPQEVSGRYPPDCPTVTRKPSKMAKNPKNDFFKKLFFYMVFNLPIDHILMVYKKKY